MKTEHIIHCGGLKPQGASAAAGAALNLWPGAGPTNIRLDILDLNERFCRIVPSRFYDLLDIATYVSQGDQMFSRGKLDVDNFGSRWRRHLHYHIPVRELDFWNDGEVQKVLRDMLEFLSDDFYKFTFYPGAGKAPEVQSYLRFSTPLSGLQPPELVTLFSGGLDSLAGAIQEIVVGKQPVALVNHLSTDKFAKTHEELVKRLRAKAGMFQPTHVRVEINKKGFEAKDHHQRARSFLFAALGGTVAMMLGLRELRFYENGVLSLNLPICGQLVGARATRTTHPRVIGGFEALLTKLAGEKFSVKTPFLWHTKGDVMRVILGADCGSLIPFSRSCAHTWETSNDEPHCGTCSQCLDRRIAVLAAHAEQHDPMDRYALDIFTQARPKKVDKILGAGYVERANQIAAMRDDSDFLCRYPEAARAVGLVGATHGAGAAKMFSLFQRHAAEVKEAVKRLVANNALAIVERTLPGDCLLRSIIESGSVTSMPAAGPVGDLPLAAEKGNFDKGAGKPDSMSKETIQIIGRLRYRDGYEDVWLDGKHFDLRDRKKARLCIEYMVKKQAFDATSALHFVDEIDPFVREEGKYPAAADIKIDHYFNDAKGLLPTLRKDLIRAAGRNGKFYLKTD